MKVRQINNLNMLNRRKLRIIWMNGYWLVARI